MKAAHIEGCIRMAKALAAGWGFSSLQKSLTKTSRHSLWVKSPIEDGWRAHKVSGEILEEDILNYLLDEAGVPK